MIAHVAELEDERVKLIAAFVAYIQDADIEPVERTTPTVGKNLTVIEQLMGNLNRFGKIGQNN